MPKPVRLIRTLLADPTTAVARGSTYDNRGNLAPAFLAQIIGKYKGTRLGRQELDAELLDDTPGALWRRELIERWYHSGAEPGIGLDQVLALGAETYPGGDPDVFNMAVMGMRLAQRVNGVSLLHGQVSREMFAGLWPGFDTREVPIGAVTNGVHTPTWVASDAAALADALRGVRDDEGSSRTVSQPEPVELMSDAALPVEAPVSPPFMVTWVILAPGGGVKVTSGAIRAMTPGKASPGNASTWMRTGCPTRKRPRRLTGT